MNANRREPRLSGKKSARSLKGSDLDNPSSTDSISTGVRHGVTQQVLLQLSVALQDSALSLLAGHENSGSSVNDASPVPLQQLVLDILERYSGSESVVRRLRLPENENPFECMRTLLSLLDARESMIEGATLEDCPELMYLRLSINHCIVSLSHRERFAEATDRAARRAVYQFAYGLTHEINNPLGNIAARAQQLLASAKTEADRRSLATIVDQSMRAHEMLAEMMRVVLPSPVHLSKNDLVTIVRDAADSLKAEAILRKIRWIVQLPQHPLYGNCDTNALTEALRSAAQNALDACRPGDSIQWICEHLLPHKIDAAPQAADYRPGEARTRIAIRDSGPGLSAMAQQRAWDLYFSGREHGRGLGISLANVRRIIESHHGMAWLDSMPDAGCTLEIRLPLDQVQGKKGTRSRSTRHN